MLVLFLLTCLGLQAAAADQLPLQTGTPKAVGGSWSGEITKLSWSPRAFHLKNFLTDEECEHIKSISHDKLEASGVVDRATGATIPSRVRTSTGMFHENGVDDIVSAIEERVAEVTMIPADHQEGLQVLKYVDGQKYEAHYDYFEDDVNLDKSRGGQRIVTVLMYLSTPEEGGETVFDNVDPSMKVQGEGWSECARQGFAHKPKKGDALLFYSLTPSGDLDYHSHHGSCPTTKGEKWCATKWIRVHPNTLSAQYQKDKQKVCADHNTRCAEWAAAGECEKNSVWMHVNCKLSCKQCTCEDTYDRCGEWAAAGECEKNSVWMQQHCSNSCKMCSQIAATSEE